MRRIASSSEGKAMSSPCSQIDPPCCREIQSARSYHGTSSGFRPLPTTPASSQRGQGSWHAEESLYYAWKLRMIGQGLERVGIAMAPLRLALPSLDCPGLPRIAPD
eukprot:CAMPEP_0201928894 /NCGR_PEP_ID=MMETSP0903-20130614/21973_1 /ASSEMBLY_ACC=CAM_ASM_000552 /TAXON_ID=420261 /ORGANISM="Thalassiosira antarctica, Strain CCMP982" /LENGTH=105 /DNA_ID=CAMNT_0048467519 /DNA_START=66 /DNA_END=380 /DNA_ORIENTATION=-